MEKEPDFAPVIRDVKMHLIKGALNRIMIFEIDSMIDGLIRLTITEPPNPDQALLATDKFYLYRGYWRAVMEELYRRYLPKLDYKCKWEIELSPYSMMLCDLTNEFAKDDELERTKGFLKISDKDIEDDLQGVIDKLGFNALGIRDIFERIPSHLLPGLKKDQLKLILRLMNFPPLGELSLFMGLYRNEMEKQLEELSIGFPGIEPSKIPISGSHESLHYSWFHINHETFKRVRLSGLEAMPELEKFRSDFEDIKKKVESHTGIFIDKAMCPCCGKEQEVTIPEEILEYKFLLEKQELMKTAGLLLYKDFVEAFKTSLAEKFTAFFPNLNKVTNPECIILVEGESEEVAIPILSFRRHFLLSGNGIQVYNCKSKQKLKDDFLNFKKNFPEAKIVCVLDSDAKKEIEDIERIIKEEKNKYRCIFIEKGTFEDLFDLDTSIEVLNELYPDGDLIVKEDFDPQKEFLANVGQIMYLKKKAKFDKVLFAKTISFKIDNEKIPKTLVEILQIAEQFSKKSKLFVK